MVCFELTIKEKKIRVQVKAGATTFEEFKQKVFPLFPQAQNAGGEFFIQFYDLDGTLQTVSTDKDFQKQLSAVSPETYFRLYVCLRLN